MALNTQTQPPPLSGSSLLHTQIKYLNLLLGRLGCLIIFSDHIFCLFEFPVALMAPHDLSSFYLCIFFLSSSSIFAVEFLLAIFIHSHSSSFILLSFFPLPLSALAIEVVSVHQPVSGGSNRKWAE